MRLNMRTFGAATAVWGASFDQMALLPVTAAIATSFGSTPLQAALILSGHGIGSICGNLLGGHLVDRIGPKRAMQVAIAAAVLTTFGYWLPLSFMTFFLVQFFHGGSTALINPATYAVLTDNPLEGSRAGRLARSGIAQATAALFASPIATMLVKRGGITALAPVLLVMLAVTGLLGYWLLQPYMAEYQKADSLAQFKPVRSESLPLGALVPAYLAALGLFMGQGLLSYVLSLLGQDLDLPAYMTGAFFSAFAAAALIMFVVGPLARLSDRFGRIPVIAFGIMLVVAGLQTINMAEAVSPIYAGMAIYGVGFGMLFPAMGALVADVTPPDKVGRAYGLLYGLFGLGGVSGPILASQANQFSPMLIPMIPLAVALAVNLTYWRSSRVQEA